MADRPILFSSSMVRALLAGTKTQTRRLLSLRGHKSFSEFGPSDTPGYDWHFRDAEKRWHDLRDAELKARLRIAVGDRLHVLEHWSTGAIFDRVAPRDITLHVTEVRVQRLQEISEADAREEGVGYRCSKCGYSIQDAGEHMDHHLCEQRGGAPIPTGIEQFRELWNSINGDGSWEANPWVAAYTFTVEHANIDALPRSVQ